ncbi:hypothetical protein CEUSTIGMA_g7450.t1 [Chlamydomonas eustigma]|uniref:Uncharacterized protein n=1 Tax=Chlamydomonas eustigma TaxID=1157962 RepID=A0A250XA98_9CHLO|nr:hypothetical protein CEUSTIGMA_g7450.t1 [Chlamydomonas eustigma]|eukprot:GAX80011.1 hypothetical protein CEUSTIGMA_g7450.t1 [Chlamydomonas eustigma]
MENSLVEIGKKTAMVRDESQRRGGATPSSDLLGALTDDFHDANTGARQSEMAKIEKHDASAAREVVRAPLTADSVTEVAYQAASPKTKPESFLKRLSKTFSLSRNSASSNASDSGVPSPKPPVVTAVDQQKAISDISKKSGMLKSSNSNRFSPKSTDLMGDLTDDFHRLKDEQAVAKQTEKKEAGDVWD